LHRVGAQVNGCRNGHAQGSRGECPLLTQSGHWERLQTTPSKVPVLAGTIVDSERRWAAMRRREFIKLIASSAVAWPRAAGAQQAPKISRIGILVQTQVERKHLIDAFKRGLYELGYVEGQNVAFEIRSAEGQTDLLPKLATELVSLQVAVIFADAQLQLKRQNKQQTKSPS
jgi:hypothetical protein